MAKLRWTRIDQEGPGLHSPQKSGDVGWDLEAAETVVLPPNAQRDIRTNVRVKLPPSCWGEIRARSSIARKGLQAEPCVLDNGYTGELFVLMRNMNIRQSVLPGQEKLTDRVIDELADLAVEIRQGTRIAQLVLHHGVWVEGEEVGFLDHDPRRGEAGFGSTGA